MKKALFSVMLLFVYQSGFCWGFFAHRKINYYAVFLLPPDMLYLFKPNIDFLSEHAVDPDKRRYVVPQEGPRHYIDIDRYGQYPFTQLPRKWEDAVKIIGEDSLTANGVLPWWIQKMMLRLTQAFREKNRLGILKYAAEIGHYISDAHVPLHACHNHNGQFSGQKGIHGFWESRVPELLADKDWNFFIGKAVYVKNPAVFTWERILESAMASDTVLLNEKKLGSTLPTDHKYAFEIRNDKIVRQYSRAYSIAYNKTLNGMIERRMRQSIFAIASFWYTAWVNAGQPDLRALNGKEISENELHEFQQLNSAWKNSAIIGKDCDEQ